MKSNLGTLIKYNFLMLLGGVQGKKSRKTSTITALFLFVVLLGAIGYTLYYSANLSFESLGTLGLESVALFEGFNTVFALVLCFGILGVSGAKKASDQDLLLSLPIKKSDIVLSKMITKYIYSFVINLLILVPYLAIYICRYQSDALTIVFSILILLLLPFCSVGLTCIIDFILGKLFNKKRLSGLFKSIFAVIVALTAIALILVKSIDRVGLNPANLNAYFSDRFFSYQMLKLVVNHELICLLTLGLLAFVPFVVGLVLTIVSFGKTSNGYVVKNKELKFGKGNGQLGLMLKKEFGVYVSTPIYVINTIIGPVGILAFAIVSLVLGFDGITKLVGGMPLDKMLVVGIVALVFSFATAMTCVSCSSISLEGKKLWIIKSTPININKLFLSKGLVNFLLLEPVIIVSSVLVLIAFKLSLVQFALILILPSLLALFVSFGGILINLLLPKLDWKDEMAVVKQSIAVLVSTMLNMLISVIPVIIFAVGSLEILTTLLISGAIYLVLAFTSIVALFATGKRLLDKI